MKIIGVYKITNPVGCVYIGRSVDVKNRWSSYRGLRCKDQIKLYRSFLKYGVEKHAFEIVVECKKEDLDKNEKRIVDEYDSIKSGLNTATVGSYPKWKTTFNKNMNTISVTYELIWQHKEHNQYKWSKCGKLFNSKTDRRIKKTVNGRSVGYWISGKFCPLTKLRLELEKIPKKEYLPF